MVLEQVNFVDMVQALERMGVYEVLFPFLLVFTILFGTLQKVKLFGNAPRAKNFNIVIAFVTAFFVLRVPSIVQTINQFLPKVSLLVIILLMFLLILGIFGTTPDGWKGVPFLAALVFALGGIIWAVADSLPQSTRSWMPSWLQLTASDKGILLAVGIFIIILAMFREKPPNSRTFGKWVSDELKPEQFGRGRSP
ncbi:MAG: hypothetical protein U9Q69_06405 [Nanoarchaeota archaeon]|nr:hypothetical protein [Nanoarchaeota archaeon]